MSFRIDDEKSIRKKYKTIWTKSEGLKNTELNAFPVYDDSYIKVKIRTYGGKVYTIFRGLNVLEDDIECESFTIISIDSLLLYESKYYLQVCLGDCVYKIVGKRMIYYLIDNPFETDEG